jgi:hypothetical protein
MTLAVAQGTFADFKLVKTRSAAQFVIEIPLELADQALKALGGVPFPGKEVSVAIARLTEQAAPSASGAASPPERAGKDIHPLIKSAGALANDPRFWTYSGTKNAIGAAEYIRFECNVKSRAEFGTDENAGKRYKSLYAMFAEWLQRGEVA